MRFGYEQQFSRSTPGACFGVVGEELTAYTWYLNEEERSPVIQSLIALKNNLAAQGRYTDAVDDVLCKVLEAKKKKLKIEYI